MVQPTGAGRPRADRDADHPDEATVLRALHDDDCRAILGATGEQARTASELTDACDIPQSSVYRKLDLLTDAGLLEERVRIRESGRHTGEYARRVEAVDLSVDAETGIDLELVEAENAPSRTAAGESQTPHAAD